MADRVRGNSADLGEGGILRAAFLGFAGSSAKTQFVPSMMGRFEKRFQGNHFRRNNDLMVERGRQMLIQPAAAPLDDDHLFDREMNHVVAIS